LGSLICKNVSYHTSAKRHGLTKIKDIEFEVQTLQPSMYNPILQGFLQASKISSELLFRHCGCYSDTRGVTVHESVQAKLVVYDSTERTFGVGPPTCITLVLLECHTRFLCQNRVLIVCMTQDHLFNTYGQKCSQITKCHKTEYNYYINNVF
jgi:hypothetical protein